ncbi:hypothetical protein NKDENANG_03774 [Candidatus Entotheonellaceae bacterium PAL068K]
MAIVYDFDGTLAPGNMQESQFLPDIGIKADKFWEEVNALTKEHQADSVLVYMEQMLCKARAANMPVKKEAFEKQGESIKLFQGVEGWFDRITDYGRHKGVHVEHYLVSSGNAEIVAGTPIASKFAKVYASKFRFDENGVAVWPALAVNFTTKTQYLFRINKGAHDLSDNSQVNRFVEKRDRPVPFENMVFIGDGPTDIPCFRLVKDQGGLSIIVFKPKTKNAKKKAEEFKKEGRVHCVAPAIYTECSKLDKVIKANINFIASRGMLHDMLEKVIKANINFIASRGMLHDMLEKD